MPVDYNNLYKDWIEFELVHIRDYATAAERFFNTELDAHGKYVADMAARLTPEQREEFVDTEVDGYWVFGELFPGMMRTSLFTHTYSFLEYHLLHLCDGLYRHEGLRLPPKALRDDGIFRARTYMKKVAGIDFPDTSAPWQEITILNVIRNIVSHGDGRLPDDHPKRDTVLQYTSRKKSVSLDHLERFQFTEAFIPETLDLYKRFFDELFAKIGERA